MRGFVEQLERHMNAVYWGDGLLDLLAGASLLGIGGAWLAELVALGSLAPAIAIVLWPVLRRRYVEPRRGYVELGAQRQADRRRLLLGSLIAGLGALALVVLVAGTASAALVRAMPGVMVGLLALATGAALELRRFAGYALVLFGGGVVAAVTGCNPGWAFVAGGAVALVGGVVLLIEFIRRYPPVAGKDPPAPEDS